MKKPKRKTKETVILSKQYDLAIIGAGPAGMMAAIRASECGADVVLLEKNHTPGAKLLLTGKERCNITNTKDDIMDFTANFGKNGKFLITALNRFGVSDTLDFFHKNEMETIIERGGRIFPEGGTAKDVQELFYRLIKKNNIALLSDCTIKSISQKKNMVGEIVLDNRDEIKAKNYLLSTGGLSYPLTGSTGDGYIWAKQMGHTIIHTEPALTPLFVKERWMDEIGRLRLKNVTISVIQDNKIQDSRFGEALILGTCLSGPIILDMSKKIGKLLENGHTQLFIDFKPALTFEKLDKRLLRDFEKHNNKEAKNILSELLPQKLIPVFLKLSKIDPLKKGREITKEERKKLRLLLKQFPLTVKCLSGFNKAIITSGGISLKDIDPKTMRSKIIQNLFFAGEILDLDGPTGGYNLQVCWSTGYLAGENAAES
ncbi:NAD(P)/FAD-dependent oxidoreductase [Candidatus Latescibacterota bacterium]